MKRLLNSKLFKITIITLLVAVAGLAWIYRSRPAPQLIISLRYEEASNGLAPDNTRFSVYDILSDEVLDKVADETGSQADRDTLTKNYSVGVGTDSEYTTSTYRITYNDGSFLNLNGEKMLSALGKVYKEYFADKYQTEATAMDVTDTSETEYIILRDHYSTEADRLYRYLSNREDTDEKYSDENGISFSDLKKEADELINTDLRDLSAYIIEKGVVLNKERTVKYLNYKNNNLTKDYTELMNKYDAYKEVIDMYDPEMSAIVMIPTLNTDREYYMSRTKTGIDYLTEKGEVALTEAQSVQRKIKENEEYMKNLGKGGNDDKANKLFSNIASKLSELSKKAKQFDSEYSSNKTSGLMSYEISTPQRFWYAPKAACVFGAWLVCVIAVIILNRKGKEKRHAKD